MKKSLIYASIVIVLIIICFGVFNIYSNNNSNLENNSNISNNNSNLENNSNISNNNSKDNLTNNNTETRHDPISPTKNFKNSNNPKKNNQPNKIPKNSKLTYTQAFKIASKFAQKSKFTEDPNVEVYIKYNTYYYIGPSKALFWDFLVYSKKNNECLAAFMVEDASGLPFMI